MGINLKKRIAGPLMKNKRVKGLWIYCKVHPNFSFYPRNSTKLYGRLGEFIFIRLHKVGGTSVADALGLEKRHHTAKDAINMVGRKNWEKSYTFAFVRNPFPKIVSSYNYFTMKNYHSMRDKPISFENWVRKNYGNDKDPFYYTVKWFQPQVEWLKDDKDEISLDKIGRFENLEDDFREISSHLGVDVPIPHLNKSKKADYRTYYNTVTYDIVRSWHHEDLITFGYNFENG